MGLPGLAGADHIGITVPDLEAATRFFVDVIGCRGTFDAYQQRLLKWERPAHGFCFGQLHNSLAGGNPGQAGMDDVLLPAPPLDADAALDPDPPLDP